MASLYWVGGTNTWNATATGKWATTSGGASGAAVPTAADDVFFDANSGTGTVTLSSGISCRSINCTGFTGTLSHNAASTLVVGDATAGASNVAIKFVAGMTYTLGNATTSGITVQPTSATTQTIDFAGKTTGNVTYSGAGSSLQYTGSHVSSGTVTLTAGVFDLNGQTCTWGAFVGTGSTTRTLTMGAAAITITNSSAAVFSVRSATNLTITANTATVTFTGTSPELRPGAFNWQGTSFSHTGPGAFYISDSGATVANLTRIGTALKTEEVRFGASALTITGTLTVTGNSATNRVLLNSYSTAGVATPGSAVTLTAAATSFANADFMDITGAGAGNWNLSAITGLSGDCGGNSGITFTASAAQTATMSTSQSWSSAAIWTSRVPLPQDDVSLSGVTGGTLSADMPRLGRNITWTGATGSPVWSCTTSGVSVFGSVTLISGMTISGTQLFTFAGRGSYTITSAGVTWTTPPTLAAPGGTYTLTDNYTNSGTNRLNINYGTFIDNGKTIVIDNVSASSVTGVRAVTLTGILNLTGIAAGNIWNFATTTNLTFSGSTVTINIVNASTLTRTFAGGGFTYGTLSYTVAGSSGQLSVTGANTFTNINFSDTTSGRTLVFPNGVTNTILGNFNVQGSASGLMQVSSAVGGSQFTLSKASGIVSCDYLNLKDNNVTGGATWYAGANSTDTGNNTGWLFSAAPTTPSAPTIGTAVAGDASATVNWTAPVSNGGATITSYNIRAYAGGSGTPSLSTTAAAGATSVLFSGLANGTAYTFDVAALNSVGTGSYSAKSNSVTPTGGVVIAGPTTNYSSQHILNLLYGSSSLTQYSGQYIANVQNGYTPTQYSFQAILNMNLGLSPTALSVQVALFRTLQTPLSLTGPETNYSVQQLLNMAYNNNLALAQVV